MNQFWYVLLGLAAGVFGGMFGIGGGIILIPAMVFLFGLTQHQAQGTSLAVLLPPIGLLATLRYWQAGDVKISMAMFISLGFFFGGVIGADIIQKVPDPLLKKIFGFVLFLVSVNMIVAK
jgi:uncharacterized protein